MNVHRWLTASRPTLPRPSVAVLGNFDGVHLGHQLLFREAVQVAQRTGLLPVAISFYPHPTQVLLGVEQTRILTSWSQRLPLFSSLGISDTLLIRFTREFSEMSPGDFLNELYTANIRHLVIGPFACIGKNREGTPDKIQKIFKELGGDVTVLESVKQGHDPHRISSSKIREDLLSGDLESVTQMLGRPYSIEGRVSRGDQRGRTIGFPTANVVAVKTTLPPHGVYLTSAVLQGETFRSMTNVGVRPTVGDSKKLSVETHILDFDRQIYGQKIAVSFHRKIRDERKFASFAELQRQLTQDRDYTRAAVLGT